MLIEISELKEGLSLEVDETKEVLVLEIQDAGAGSAPQVSTDPGNRLEYRPTGLYVRPSSWAGKEW